MVALGLIYSSELPAFDGSVLRTMTIYFAKSLIALPILCWALEMTKEARGVEIPFDQDSRVNDIEQIALLFSVLLFLMAAISSNHCIGMQTDHNYLDNQPKRAVQRLFTHVEQK